MPYMIVNDKENNKYCVHKQNADKSAGDSLHCYTGEDAEKKAKAYMRALYAHENDLISQDFLFTELAGSKAFDGMASGKFTDMHGTAVEIMDDDLPAIVEQTKAVIASTATESGEIVGLPIDEENHNHKGGAGWIVDVSMDESGKKIRFVPKWTEIGLKLLGDNIRRFFSVSVDLKEKVILGGSLTNWPATRTKEGKLLLRPIELSTSLLAIDDSIDEKVAAVRNTFYEQFKQRVDIPLMSSYIEKVFDDYAICRDGNNLFKATYTTGKDGKIKFADRDQWVPVKLTYKELNMDPNFVQTGLQRLADEFNGFISKIKGDKPEGDTTMTLPPTSTAAPVAPVTLSTTVNPSILEFLQTPEGVQELGRQAELKAQEAIQAEKRKIYVMEFASTLVGGTPKAPFGLPIKADEVVALLLSLPENQAKAVEMMLTKTKQAVIAFKEAGFSGEFNVNPRLPEAFRPSLQMWIGAGRDIKSFFEANTELGKADDYNLNEFIPKEK